MNKLEINNLLAALTKAASVDKPLDFSQKSDREFYVGNLHGSGDPVSRLKKAIERTEGQSVHLFTGQPGSGKSTELKRLQYQLQKEHLPGEFHVSYIDLKEWINVHEEINLSNFLVGLIAAWVMQIDRAHKPNGWLDRFYTFLTTTNVVPKEISLNVGAGESKANLKLALETDANFRAALDEAVKKQGANFVQQAHRFIATVQKELCANGSKCVLLVDSLEQIRGYGSTDNINKVYASLQKLFLGESSALKLPGLHLVYSISPFVFEQNPQLAALYGTSVVVNMPSVHVFLKKSTDLDPAGVTALTQLVTKRFVQWDKIFTDAQLQKIIRASGGDLRDFLRMLRIASLEDTASLPLPDSAIDFAMSQVAPPKSLPIEDIVWMAAVETNHDEQLGDKQDGLFLHRYLASKHVLAYYNGSTWYSVHPLIRDWVLSKAALQVSTKT